MVCYDSVWVTPSDGVIEKIDDTHYSNSNFVSMIHSDTSSLGYMMSSQFPTPTSITLRGDIPPSWVQWHIPTMSDDDIADSVIQRLSSMNDIPEIPGNERLWIPKKKQSQRIRHIAPMAFFSVTSRGIISQGIPPSVIDALASIVAGVYMIVERATIASIKSKQKTTVSPSRKTKITTAYDIISSRHHVATSSLISVYAEPSTTTAMRLFYVSCVLGVERTHKICDMVYYTVCEEQLFSIEETMSTFIVS